MPNFNSNYKDVNIVEDDSDGLITVSVLQRFDEQRKTKLKNNFIGVLARADSQLLHQLAKKLNHKLPKTEPTELVIGMYKSGIIAAGYLAFVRKSHFLWSTPDRLGDYKNAVCYTEDHRGDKSHYLYDIKPGDQIILVEDEATSGTGLIGLTKVLREHGAEVIAIASFLETVNFGARGNIKAETGLDLVSLTKVELR